MRYAIIVAKTDGAIADLRFNVTLLKRMVGVSTSLLLIVLGKLLLSGLQLGGR